MRLSRHLAVVLTLLALIFAPTMVRSQDAIVYGVMFYSPNCPHCHEVLTNHWPKIQAEFGDQLRVLFISTDTALGRELMQGAALALKLESAGVPMLVIGSEVLIGSVSIPESAPTIIRTGVQNGGIALPSLPGVEDLYRATVDGNGGAVAYIGRADPATSANSAGQTLIERLSRDPVANLLAILILVLLLFTLVGLAVGGWQYATERNPRWLRTLTKRARPDMLLLLSAIGAAITLSLLAGWSNDWFILLLAGGELLVFSSVMIGVNSALKAKPLPRWIVPVLAVAGIAVATYLTYIELTLSSAVCGLLGNCNLVQQSAYARIFNVPIGVLGLVGYGAIMLMWLLRRGALEWANRALLALAVFGVAFSTYLTFLEPFVIGATCMWCLLSAVLMLMLLWSLITPVSKPSRRGHSG